MAVRRGSRESDTVNLVEEEPNTERESITNKPGFQTLELRLH